MMTKLTAALRILTGSDLKVQRMITYWAITMLLYALCVLLLWVEVGIGATPPWQAACLSAFALAGLLLFYILIRSSVSLGLSAAHLALGQAYYAVFAIVAAYAIAAPMRGASISLLLVVLVFCTVALKPRSSHALSGFALFLLGLCMLCMAYLSPQNYHPAQEAVNFVFAGSMLLAVAFLTDQFNLLRQRLVAQKEEISAALARVKTLATRDELTLLPNRMHMRELLSHEANRHKREGQTLCLAMLDLDLFKRVNDTWGHAAGDEVLRIFAERAQSVLRVTDVLARWGGEEFFLLMPNTGIQAAKLVLERMRSTIEDMDLHHIDPHLRVTFSAGLTALSAGEQAADAIRRADKALYQAKSAGRNAVRLFDADMEAAVAARAELERDLYEGLRCQQFELYYQAQVNAEGNVTGAEALVRWLHPRRGFLLPEGFIPLAEEMGLVVPLGHWVLQSACRQLALWSKNPATAQLNLSVNVSARQFRHRDFFRQVRMALDENDINAQRLRLELTESILVEDIDDTIAKMSALKAQGVSFSLDDFGTGYSSLAYLKRLPIDELKIDQSFVKDVLTDSNDAAIACTIVTLAHSLGLAVIAEGVETEGQRAFLVQNGCSHFQGYLYSRPHTLAEFEQFVATGARRSAQASAEVIALRR